MSDALASFSTEELLKIKSGDVSGLSTEKLQLLRGILSQAPMFSAPDMPPAAALPPPAPAPTQRLRSIAQGATMGGADELEASLRSAVSGETYDQALADIRGKMKAYQQQSPLEALAYEGLGPCAAVHPYGSNIGPSSAAWLYGCRQVDRQRAGCGQAADWWARRQGC